MQSPASLSGAEEHEDNAPGAQVQAISGTPPKERQFKDPIHDYIPISPRVCAFIDTKQFQRLRSIKQLGTSYWVWPGASHNRFEHSLGVAYLARRLATHLQRNQPELKITDRDVECVEIAGLCHDLGHGPWSHVFDGLFLPAVLKDRVWHHEDGSELMFDYLVEENDIDITPEDAQFIKALIAGDPSRDEKLFLFDIVANKRNGIDVDKFDYIQRDTHMYGDPISISIRRIIHSARVLDNQICYDIKDANALYEICATRFKLHKMIYNHKTAKAMEYMVVDALLLADPIMQISEKVFKPEDFVHLTDNIMPWIEASKEPELAPARAIFDRIRKRDLYRRVDYKVVHWDVRKLFEENVTPERIFEATKALAKSNDSLKMDDLNVDDIIVSHVVMHYGMKDRNPLDQVKFYSKANPHQCANAGTGDYSNLQPAVFAEVYMSVYTKRPQFFGIVQAGYREVLQNISKRTADPLEGGAAIAPTPPASEAPSTPLAQPRRASLTFGSRSNSFSNNNFTTVPPDYALGSPTRHSSAAKAKNAKRKRDKESTEPDELKKPKRTKQTQSA
ncbi:hypothetical protein AX16_000125 [Volvariella volvacea WC 439]|nr:hypothetical protein AX16_000125 [Volvariella volvacea WC 439]